MAFELPKLKYDYDALEPHIDARTMEIHHSKHHNGYTTKLNAAIEGTDLDEKSIEDILINLDMSNSAVRNNGGGFYNHSLFWEVMNPEDRGYLSGELKDAVEAELTDLDIAWLKRKMKVAEIDKKIDYKKVTKIVSGKKLWNYDNLEPTERKGAI